MVTLNVCCVLTALAFCSVWQCVEEQVKFGQGPCLGATHLLVIGSEENIQMPAERLYNAVYRPSLQDNVDSLAGGNITPGWKQTRLLKKKSVPPSSQSCDSFNLGQLQMRLWERGEFHEGDGVAWTQGAWAPQSLLKAAVVPGGKPLPHHGMDWVHHTVNLHNIWQQRSHKSILSVCKPCFYFFFHFNPHKAYELGEIWGIFDENVLINILWPSACKISNTSCKTRKPWVHGK